MAESPYQAPESNVTPKPAGSEEEQDLATFVGPSNAEYYLLRFRGMRAGASKSWHWPAFFISSLWLLYRKMWLPALAYILGLPILYVIVSVLLSMALDLEAGDLIAALMWAIVAFIAVPTYAARLYFNRAEAKIAAINAKGLEDDARRKAIEAAGGTNLAAPIVLLIVIPAILGFLAAITLPAYEHYTIRAQVSEGLSLSAEPKSAIMRYHEANGEFPPHNTAAGLPAPEELRGLYVSSVTVDGSLIIVNYGGEAHGILQGSALLIGLDAEALPSYRWLCGSNDIDNVFLPSACRDE